MARNKKIEEPKDGDILLLSELRAIVKNSWIVELTVRVSRDDEEIIALRPSEFWRQVKALGWPSFNVIINRAERRLMVDFAGAIRIINENVMKGAVGKRAA